MCKEDVVCCKPYSRLKVVVVEEEEMDFSNSRKEGGFEMFVEGCNNPKVSYVHYTSFNIKNMNFLVFFSSPNLFKRLFY